MTYDDIYKAWQTVGADVAGLKWGDFVKALAEQPAQQQKPTCKQNLQVWVIPNGKGGGQFSWEPEDERFWTRMQPAQREPLTDAEKRELIKKSELWDMHLHVGWYSAPSKSFVEKTIKLISEIEAAHGITSAPQIKENT